jgi:uncharacterized protein DUF6788
VRHVPTSRLTRRRQQLLDELGALGPVLRATVIERFTQCGKGNCKCMRGEKHGPAYYLAVSYAKGRTRQVYIPKTLRPVAETWVQNYHQALAVLEEVSSIDLELLRRKTPEAG